MQRNPPPLNFVRSFECAARHLSFTKASHELGYTKAAISTHVRSLETYLGRALFVRGSRSLQLTEVGEAFLPTLRQALAQVDSATEAIVTGAHSRSVVLACPMSLAENWLPACLSGFAASHPEIEVVVNGTVWTNPEHELADVTITVNREDEVPDGARQLWPERLTLLCAPALAGSIHAPPDLDRLPKIMVSGRQEYWTIMAEALGTPRFDLERVMRTNSTNISLEMAAQGLGLTVALVSLSGTYLRRGLLVQPFDVRPPSPWTYYIARRQGLRGSAAATLMAYLRDVASRMEDRRSEGNPAR